MKYKSNLKFQLMFAIIGFFVSLMIFYVFTKQIDWITAGIIGIVNFIAAGFYNLRKK